MAKEVGPLGVKVTIVEPGGFRTDFAGSSTELREGRPEYDATVGNTARFQRDYDGKQPGDPARAAAALLKLASVEEPPLRIVLGIDAFNAAEANDLAKIELGEKVRLQNQLEALLEEAHIKLSSLVSDLLGASARRMLKALADGENRSRGSGRPGRSALARHAGTAA